MGTNFGSDLIVLSETQTATNYHGSWMKFDLSSLTGQTVTSAQLQLTSVFNHSSTAINHVVYSSSDDSWSEGTVSGLNQPSDATLTSLDTVSIPNVNGVYSWDVLSAVNGPDGADGTLTLFIRPETYPVAVTRGPHFNSKEAGVSIPTLTLFTTASAVPEPGVMPAIVGFSIVAAGFISRRIRRK
ncbi:MAG: DNRLRE domain-containing protein [Planctomycetaceae bacterium]|nr:DNRLRE domain-containing protein [Planctomycetaceae bacterium]